MILWFWAKMNAPTEAQIAEQKRIRDSIKAAQVEETDVEPAVVADLPSGLPDSLLNEQLVASHGVFAPAAAGTAREVTVENDLMRMTFSTKGAQIREVLLKEFTESWLDTTKTVQSRPLKMLSNPKNKLEYILPVGAKNIKTSSLYFEPTVNGQTIVFRASAGNGRYFEQKYTLTNGTYAVDYTVRLVGLDNDVNPAGVQLRWIDYLNSLEENINYERNYSTAYYYSAEDEMDHCSCTSDDAVIPEERVKWVSHSNQFFNSTLMAKNGNFGASELAVEMLPENSESLKKLTTQLSLPMESGAFAMNFYVGPNEYDRLQAQGNALEDIIPYGSSIFGTINRWLIRPAFELLTSFIPSKGWAIVVLTLIVKLLMFPLTYKMVYSQQKMAALKPKMAKVRDKYKDDQQAAQLETMKMYREYGVNPVGGCLPVLVQMPIWFALFRFFPASIQFRQAPFLWAHDLSSYDVIAWLPFEIPFFGAHISLFTVLYGVSMIAYTYYNSKQMDMSAMGGNQQAKMMMYMQYMMPIMFLFFFNSYAAGLTTYMFTSNIMNISLMLLTKNVLIDKKKIEAELAANKAKPKKKGGFSERLAEAMKEQQRIQAQKEATKRRGRK